MNIEFHAHRDSDPVETQEWLDSLQAVLHHRGPGRVRFLLDQLIERGQFAGATPSPQVNTPYVNTIRPEDEPEYPGDRELERRIKGLIRWNAMAMVVRAGKKSPGIGGHLATYASAATLYEVGFNHFFMGKDAEGGGDQIFFQGHASPGIYARAFLEGRLTEQHLENFRRELANGGGLSSYPHPWLMPDFWEHPTVSMGLGPITSIYQARFNRYLQDRGLANTDSKRVWAFLGDGECDEPESLGAITLATREGLNNLTWVVNCNLQRLDGPVRGNGKIIQELEAIFRGAGWNVIKVIWSGDWDPLLAADTEGHLVRRMGEVVDGWYQKYIVEDGAFIRKHICAGRPELERLFAGLTDEQVKRLKPGGHDPIKVYAAYDAAIKYTAGPTVILARTIKGYALDDIEGRNTAHQKKTPDKESIRKLRDRYDIPIPDAKLEETPFYHPGMSSPEVQYLLDRRRALGGPVPRRRVQVGPIGVVQEEPFAELKRGSGANRAVSTTMAFVSFLSKLLKDPEIGKLIVPIVPDEARTFGMETLFRQCGIYSHIGQLYEPVDANILLYYKESKDGQILQEGINEAGALCSFTAAGTAYATHGINMIPFYIFYSMFGFQRVADLIWANADSRGKGFLLGATAGRTTLNGEGLQHEDGHSHLLASTVPTCQCYDPAFAYEIGLIIADGLKRMYRQREDIFYYLTLYNQNYEMPPMPPGVEEGVLKGLYKFKASDLPKPRHRVHLFGSGPLILEALRAQQILAEELAIAADVWSVTSYVQLRREALDVERRNLLDPFAPPAIPYLTRVLQSEPWPVVAVSDFMKIHAEQVARWTPAGLYPLGTDGFGRSESREALRRFFEIDAEHIALAAAVPFARKDAQVAEKLKTCLKKWQIDPNKPNPARS